MPEFIKSCFRCISTLAVTHAGRWHGNVDTESELLSRPAKLTTSNSYVCRKGRGKGVKDRGRRSEAREVALLTSWPAFSQCLHWLRVPGRIEFKIAVLTYKVVHGLVPWYLGPFTRVADLPCRRSLRSVGTNRLVVPTSRLSTVGSRVFPVAAPQTWNDLSEDVWHQQNLSPHFVASSTHICSEVFSWLLAGHQLTVSGGPSSSSAI